MQAENAAGDVVEAAQVEDVTELRRLLAAAQRSAETSRRRASDASTQASRWRNHRDEFATAARAALGMGPPGPVNIHTGPILARLGEVLAERDMAVARLAAAGKALDDERGEHAQTIKALEGQRALQRTERKAIAAREGAVERRMEAARAEAERTAERTAKALEAMTERAEKAKRRASQLELEVAVARREKATRDSERHERVALAQARKRIEALEADAQRERAAAQAAELRALEAERAERAARRELERLQAAPVVEPKRAAAGPAPSAPLVALLKTGPSSIRRHGARLEAWAAGGAGPALEAARAMAAALEGGEVTGSARLAALTGLAGLLGGV